MKKNNGIKICYVVTIPLTIESFFIPQLQYLAANGFDVTVVCADDEFLQKKLGKSVKYHPIKIPRGISIWGSIVALNNLTKFFKNEQFDMIQYSTPNAAFYASIAARKAHCKIRNYHLMGLRYLGAKGIKRILLKCIEKLTCNNSSSIECVSPSNLELGIQEKLFPPGKAAVVWNGSTGGVDLTRFNYSRRCSWRQEVRAELGYNKNDFVFGYVGRITKDKGANEILGAFLSLKTDAKLFLIGPEENTKSLDSDLMMKAQNNDNVKFHHAVSDIERYYAAIDVLLLPSYREGFGNVVIEAGALGTPAIVSDIPGLRDTAIRDKTALVVSAKNTVELAEAMKRIQTMDYIAMGKNAVQFASENFDGMKLCEKILERKKYLIKRAFQ